MSGDPILDGITRFGLRGLPGYPTDDVVVVVPFSDLPALLAAVREDERGKVPDNGAYTTGRLLGYVQGQRDEQKRIRFAIAALVDGDAIDLSLREYRAVIEAIDEQESS